MDEQQQGKHGVTGSTIKQNLWLLTLVFLALALGLYYNLAPDGQQTTPAAAPSPAVESGGEPIGSTAAATAAAPPALPGPAAALPGLPEAAQPPTRVAVPGPLPPQPYSVTKKLLPQLLPAGAAGAAGRPGALDDSLLTITGQSPLPAGARLEVFRDPLARFSLDVPAGWKTEPEPEGAGGPLLAIRPPDDAAGSVQATVYSSNLPPTASDMLISKMIEAVEMRGEKLVHARSVRDGESTGIEVVSEIPAADGGPVVRQRAFFVRQGSQLLQLLSQAPQDRWAGYEPYFHAMARSLKGRAAAR